MKKTNQKIRAFVFLILLCAGNGADVFAKDWKGLVPCVSTRSDAERFLEKINDEPRNWNIYDHKEARVHINYRRVDDNNPGEDIVIVIMVYPKNSMKLMTFKKKYPDFDEDFLRTELPQKITHVYGSAEYTNGSLGLQISARKDDSGEETIYSLMYFGTDESCKELNSS
jgi:hypothetical protein